MPSSVTVATTHNVHRSMEPVSAHPASLVTSVRNTVQLERTVKTVRNDVSARTKQNVILKAVSASVSPVGLDSSASGRVKCTRMVKAVRRLAIASTMADVIQRLENAIAAQVGPAKHVRRSVTHGSSDKTVPSNVSVNSLRHSRAIQRTAAVSARLNIVMVKPLNMLASSVKVHVL